MSNAKQNGKVAFITGGNRGLGLETARELGKQGIVVVLGSRDSKKGEAAAAKLRNEGITAESLGFDVNKSQDYQKAYDYFEKKYGRLDILVNNAGVWKESDTSSPSSVPKPGHRGVAGNSARNFRNQFLCDRRFDSKTAAADSQSARRSNRKCFQHSWITHTSRRPCSPIYAFKVFAYNASKTALNRSPCISPTNYVTPKSK